MRPGLRRRGRFARDRLMIVALQKRLLGTAAQEAEHDE